MAQVKILGERRPQQAGAVAGVSFTPVPAKPQRISRGRLWADRVGVPAPDFNRLSLMRAMERKNRG